MPEAGAGGKSQGGVGRRSNDLGSLHAITFGFYMRSLSSTNLRANLSLVRDQVNDDHEPVVIHRVKGRPVVMVSLEDWASMGETAYLIASPANRAALMQAIPDGREGKAVIRTPKDLKAHEAEPLKGDLSGH